MKRLAIIGSVGLPANYGGFETLVENLVKELSDKLEITVYCSSKAYSEKLSEYQGARLKYIPLNANGIQSIPYDIWGILSALWNTDCLLILGVGGCMILPLLRGFGCRKKIIVNIDGMEWRRNKWSKWAKAFLRFSEKMAVRYADITIGDNKVIADYVKEEYHAPCELIEYGADHQTPQTITQATLHEYPFLSEPYAFSVCRIEPENNVHLLLKAFAESPDQMPFVIIGNWKRSPYGNELYEQYGKIHHIHLLDPIYDSVRLNEFRSNCKLYLHGHSCGGTNPSLIEAMYLGLPIAAFDVNFNRETSENKALYFKTEKDLQEIIANHGSASWKEIGIQMYEIANRRYTWKRIASCYGRLCQ